MVIEDIAERIAMGPFGSNIKTDNFVPTGVPVIRGGNLNAWRFRSDDFVFLTEEKANELKNSNAFPDDIVITHRGTLGQVGIVPRDKFARFVVSQSQLKISVKKDIVDPNFVFYFFKSSEGQQKLLMNVAQVGVPAISRPINSIKQIRLDLPPLPTQRAIAHVLGTLDDLIELNRETNAVLEAMARALFESWFVEFDPVRAKAEGRAPAGMDAATAALFPERFVESELGLIPEGWRVEKLGDVVDFSYGKPLKAGDRKDGPFQVFGSNGQVGWHNEFMVSGPGIVVGRKGNPGVVTWVDGDFFPIDTTFYVVTKGKWKSLPFFYYALLLQDLGNLSADSAVPGLNRNHAYMSKQICPDPGILEAFDAQVTPLFNMIRDGSLESRTLAELRDTLLPKLLSGEVSPPEAAEQVKEATAESRVGGAIG